jgi:glucokinase
MIVLAGDIGGTHARLAIVEIDRARWLVRHHATFSSPDYPGLAPIVRQYMQSQDVQPDRAGFGVPCPVRDGPCNLANLDWQVDPAALASEIGIAHTTVVNDFEAIGHAVPMLGSDDLAVIQDRPARRFEPIAIIGAGTGLGQAFLVWNGSHYDVLPSEGGHADFAPRNTIETEMFLYWKGTLGRISWERFLSGPGLVRIYQFLVATHRADQSETVEREMMLRDPAAVISDHAMANSDSACVQALDMFASIYGAQAANLALALRSTGGLFLAGGIAPRIVDKLRDGTFITAFHDKGRLSHITRHMPVHIIMQSDVGIIGAAAATLRDPS